MDEKFLKPSDAALFLNLSKSWLAQSRMRGDGPAFLRLAPRLIRYRIDDLESWLDARQRRSTVEA